MLFFWLNLALFFFLFFTAISAIWWFAPWVPTYRKDFDSIEKLAELKPKERFVEIGCGDARVSAYLAKKYPKNEFIGYEIFFPIYIFAKIRSFLAPHKNLSVKWRNVFWENLSNADVVYVFGMKESVDNELRKKFEKELKNGARIISYVFQMKNWKGEQKSIKSQVNQTKINQYTHTLLDISSKNGTNREA